MVARIPWSHGWRTLRVVGAALIVAAFFVVSPAIIAAAPPTIANISPNSGPTIGATPVMITGANLSTTNANVANTTVSFGGVAARAFCFGTSCDTQFAVIVPAHAAGAVDVTVTTAAGSVTLAHDYTYTDGLPLPAPTVDQVSPPSGPTAGNTNLTIRGTGFQAAATVTVGGAVATNVAVQNATTISATTPAHAAGAVDVVVTNPDSQGATKAGGYRYTDEVTTAPYIAEISPNRGPTIESTAVVIRGVRLSTSTTNVASTTVTFGGVPGSAFCFASGCDTQFIVIPPDHAAGAVDVTVTTAVGSATLTGGFTYGDAPIIAGPVVNDVTPVAGPTAGNTGLTITGTGFLAGATVTVGGITATGATVQSGTAISAITPAHNPGTVDVTVTNPDGQSATKGGAFTYVRPANPPTIAWLNPDNALATANDTPVTIVGTDFQPGASVTFGGTPAAPVAVESDTVIRTTAPAHMPGGVDVIVTNPDGQRATAASAFTYIQAPRLTGISPSMGPATGGTRVTLTGTGFQRGAIVRFGDSAAADVEVRNETTMLATAPPHAAGPVQITLANPATRSGAIINRTNRTAAESGSATIFTYIGRTPPPTEGLTITHVSPAQGVPSGGEQVVITGAGFVSGMKVTFGGIAATNIQVQDPTTATVTTPAHAVGTVDVTVSDASGTGTANLPGGYRYAERSGDAPTIVPPPARGAPDVPPSVRQPPGSAPPSR